MANVAEKDETRETQENGGDSGGGRGSALKAAAAAAAAGAAAIATQKALSKEKGKHDGSRDENEDGRGSKDSEGKGLRSSLLRSLAEGGWDSARDVLIPAAEDAAGAAGAFLAHNGPELLRERIIPRFVSSFREASSS